MLGFRAVVGGCAATCAVVALGPFGGGASASQLPRGCTGGGQRVVVARSPQAVVTRITWLGSGDVRHQVVVRRLARDRAHHEARRRLRRHDPGQLRPRMRRLPPRSRSPGAMSPTSTGRWTTTAWASTRSASSTPRSGTMVVNANADGSLYSTQLCIVKLVLNSRGDVAWDQQRARARVRCLDGGLRAPSWPAHDHTRHGEVKGRLDNSRSPTARSVGSTTGSRTRRGQLTRVRRRRRRRLDVLCSRGLRRPPTREGPASADLRTSRRAAAPPSTPGQAVPRPDPLRGQRRNAAARGAPDSIRGTSCTRAFRAGSGLASAPGRSSSEWRFCCSGSRSHFSDRGSARSATSWWSGS